MDRSVCCLLLLLSWSQTSGKYVLVQERKTWSQAQTHCRLFFTDLAPVSDQQDNDRLKRMAENHKWFHVWIGLTPASTKPIVWKWSGGGNVTRTFWRSGMPKPYSYDHAGVLNGDSWINIYAKHNLYFFCFRAIVVTERLTWEEALDYCRHRHGDLASVASDTEMLLIQKELGKFHTTERVWIGLRFLQAQWLWVDQRPLGYQAWGGGGNMTCPVGSCAALQPPSRIPNVFESGDIKVLDQTEPVGEWVPLHCNERLNFVCY